MPRSSLRFAGAVCLVITILLAQMPVASAAVADWQKGATISPSWAGDFGTSSFAASLQRLQTMHANAVSLIIPYYQSTTHTTDIRRGWNTPTDGALIAGIDAAHALGLKVMLKIHLESDDHAWRAEINPPDRNAWFTAYGAVLRHYAQLAQAHGVESMCLGTELIKMTSPLVDAGNTQRWQQMIADVRSLFGGKLTYSANHGGNDSIDEKKVIGFWPSLDEIGISAYHPLSGEVAASVQSMQQEWDRWNTAEVAPLSAKYGKDVLFTEVGYRSITGAHTEPASWSLGGCYDPSEQMRDYEALFSAWNADPHMQGIFLWDWKSNTAAGGRGDTGFTPQQKPAEQLIAQWFGTGRGFSTAAFEKMNSPALHCQTGGAGDSSSSQIGEESSSPIAEQPPSSGTESAVSSSSSSSAQVEAHSGAAPAGNAVSTPPGAGGGISGLPGTGIGGHNGSPGGATAPPSGAASPSIESSAPESIPPPAYGGGPVIPAFPPNAGKGAVTPVARSEWTVLLAAGLTMLIGRYRRRLFP